VLSVRQFEQRFLHGVGIAPKLFARIAPCQAGIDAKMDSQGLSWLRIAHEFGYHDQMHMVRAFRMLGSNSPGILFKLGDIRPESLADSVF
jgi:AraC-like DNA-binding protein